MPRLFIFSVLSLYAESMVAELDFLDDIFLEPKENTGNKNLVEDLLDFTLSFER